MTKRIAFYFLLVFFLFAQAKVNKTETGTIKWPDLRWLAPYSTIASPPSSPFTGQWVIFTDAILPGRCDTGGGSSLATCRYSGAAWVNASTAALASQYKIVTCQPGMGDGVNAIVGATYPLNACLNEFGVTWTITSIKCFTDNSGSSTLSATNGAGTALLTGAVTCTSSFASGTQSGTTTISSADRVKLSFVADGTTKEAVFVITGTI